MKRHAKASSATTVSRPGSGHARAVLASACLCALGLLAFLGIGTSAALATPPTLTIDPVANPGYASAHLSGKVEVAADGYETYWCFEFAEEGTSNWSGFCYQGPIQPGETATVEADPSGLKPGTHYEARLSALNFIEFAEEHSSTQTFTTESVNPPEAEIDPAGSIDSDSAHLSGTVNSGGSGAGEKAGTYSISCSPSCPSAEGSHNFQAEGFADGADHAVQADAEGLLPNTEYTVTLTAQNAAGQESDQTTFTTDAIAPEAITAFVAPRTTTTARLNAYVTPNNSDTTYYFQYGPEDCSANPCTSVPVSEDAPVGPSDMESHIVSQEVEGLSESTTYHYRVIAENVGGTSAGTDKMFETRSAAEMVLAPRGYEMVNPPDKGNQNVEPLFESYGLSGQPGDAGHTNTPDGEATAWMVFGGAPGGGVGSQNSFVSTRGSGGWSTISMVGPGDKQAGGGDKGFRFVAASPDLSHFILTTTEGFEEFSDVTVVRADRAGNQEALVTFPQVHNGISRSVETSEDLQRVLLVDPYNGKLYDYGSGTPEEVGLMPDGSSPACGVDAFFEWPRYHWIARDGSRVFFQSSGPSCSGHAAIYVRNRETEETTQVAPEGRFIRASRDGRKAVLRTYAALTGEDHNSTSDLYMWSESSGNKCLTCSVPNAEVEGCADGCANGSEYEYGAVEVSEDLSRVYFRSPNTLTPDEHRGGGAYVVETAVGSIHYAGNFPLIPHPGESLDRGAKLTPDGRGALIETAQHPTDDEIACGGCKQIYYYDDVTRSIECVSCVRGGVTKQAASTSLATSYSELSDDGHTIAFVTPEKLVPNDVNGGMDVYQWHNGKIGLITDGVTKFPGGQSGEASYGSAPTVRGISANGRDIFFSVIAPLTGFEHDGLSNLYDARIGGGFPRPHPPVHCDGDSCRGSLEVPPAPIRSATSTISGEGNAGEGSRCRSTKEGRRGRCAARRAKCPKKSKAKRRCTRRQANAQRRRSPRDSGGGAK